MQFIGDHEVNYYGSDEGVTSTVETKIHGINVTPPPEEIPGSAEWLDYASSTSARFLDFWVYPDPEAATMANELVNGIKRKGVGRRFGRYYRGTSWDRVRGVFGRRNSALITIPNLKP